MSLTEDHGDARNVAFADLKKAAEANRIPVKKAAKNKDAPDQEPRSMVTRG